MFFLWKDSLYKWLLFGLILFGALWFLPMLILGLPGDYLPFYLIEEFLFLFLGIPLIPTLLLCLVSLIGWFCKKAMRPIGTMLICAPSVVMLLIDGIVLAITLITITGGTFPSFTEVILPTLFRIAYHSAILTLQHLWQV